ncbi:ring-cleaving dioxygenase [Rhodobacteraceae bacterium 2376]|uniref:Ring-cleaving dioxygenase n=1 Tax=Rhabdonatronobacter sediminivivens TaxID=2743469 RepID=A0A7Z0HYN8_9RHOB|nr:ring-cleaving dioxygenase [Rhabdonatronobacter sediminivivens]NYS24702.1 ring-cleaving dioxygenase [Rhabdonatronobacter sediminivivens]
MSDTTTPIAGLHHVTAISGPPQPNVDFYIRDMGQRLVKKTVNFDAPDVWHLYYGDQQAAPGSILTFFPFVGARAGRAGPGMASAFAYGVSPAAFDSWAARLQGRTDARFGARVLELADPDGLQVELIEDTTASAQPGAFHSATLWLENPEPTARLLIDGFGYAEAGSERGAGGERLRLELPNAGAGRVIDLWRANSPAQGAPGAGTIHHIAFRARDDAHQDDLRERLIGLGMQVTPRIDRQYFNAIYFREPGGVLFEVATDPPGFDVDEPMADLGTALKLPPQYELRRAQIESALPPFTVPA